MAKETVVLSACPVLVKETIAELSVRPVAAVEAVIKLFVLLFAVMMVSFGGLLVVLVPLRWLAASPLLPALPAPPWPPALPPFLIHLPLHGPGPPSLPLIHLHSTSHLKLLDFLWSVWKPLFRGRVMSQSVVGSAQLSQPRALSLSHCLCVLNCVSHHPLHLLLVHYCQLVIIDSLASPYKYLVHFVFSCVSIAFCSCVAIFVSCFAHMDYVFWTLKIKLQKDLFVWAFLDRFGSSKTTALMF